MAGRSNSNSDAFNQAATAVTATHSPMHLSRAVPAAVAMDRRQFEAAVTSGAHPGVAGGPSLLMSPDPYPKSSTTPSKTPAASSDC